MITQQHTLNTPSSKDAQTLGTVVELWRYAVSSLGGEMCHNVNVTPQGIEGDRQFALFDPANGNVAAPEKDPGWRPALYLSSTINASGDVHIHFPDGKKLDIANPDLLEHLSQHFGFHVALGRYANTASYKDANLPVIANRYDPCPLHIVTTSSLAKLSDLIPHSQIDRRRFRPSILLQTDDSSGFLEDTWMGRTLCVETVRAPVSEKTKRCGMTFVSQPDLDEQPEILRTILRSNGRCLGTYCDVSRPGSIQTGHVVSFE
jgi:uncharacterized protein